MSNQLLHYNASAGKWICQGRWDLTHLAHLQTLLAAAHWPTQGAVTLDGAAIQKMDSAGAWLLIQLKNQLQQKGLQVAWLNFQDAANTLLALVEKRLIEEGPLPPTHKPSFLEIIGKNTVLHAEEFREYLHFVGGLSFELLRLLKHPLRWRWNALASVLYRTGYQGLPIIALLSFLIGVVLTYQMGLQLRNYGASIYIVDLLGLSVLREFGPLITAIMVSGRTGSAFTATIGMMKLNQEVDALDTMGVTPGELLLLPRILGLFIALPLLTVWSDIFGVFGGMVMSNNMLGITWYDFLQRFPTVIPLKTLILGLGKTPIFALIIASIGCFQGMQVKNSADSVGLNTTRSVVLSIFFIIVADALFSIIFSKMHL